MLRYRSRLSGALIDRIDLAVEVPTPSADALDLSHRAPTTCESKALRARVAVARDRQLARQAATNARLDAAGVASHCALTAEGQSLLAHALKRMSLSARAYHRVAKVARTIADLADRESIEPAHVAEAIGYRRFDAAGSSSRSR